MAEILILGLLSICGAIVCIRYLLYKCSKEESEYVVQTNVVDDNEVPPKYEDINN